MGIKVTSRTLPVSPTAVRTILQRETDNFGTFFSLDRILYHQARYARIAHRNYPEFRALCGSPGLRVTEGTVVRNILINRFGVDEYKLELRGKPSMDKNVIAKLFDDPYISADTKRVLELYREIRAAEYMSSYLNQYRYLPISNCLDMNGERMVVGHPVWEILSTSRFSASKPSFQNINRDICDIYTAPRGWQLVFSDSGQIEPRITYSAYIRDELIVHLITAYDDAYYGLLHYISMTPKEQAAARANLSSVKPHEVTEEMKDKRRRLKVLGLAGNYGSANLSAIDAELGPLYEEMIVNHPVRKELEAQIIEQVRRGAECFYGYFGTPVAPDSTASYTKGASGWVGHMVRCGINNPIQTTAAELMCMSVQQAKQLLGPNDHIGYYKHDEGMFYVQDDHVDELAPKLQNCLSYDVEGWIPIGSDLHIGRKESPYAPDFL